MKQMTPGLKAWMRKVKKMDEPQISLHEWFQEVHDEIAKFLKELESFIEENSKPGSIKRTPLEWDRDFFFSSLEDYSCIRMLVGFRAASLPPEVAKDFPLVLAPSSSEKRDACPLNQLYLLLSPYIPPSCLKIEQNAGIHNKWQACYAACGT
jgi:hypothetical protein